MALEQLKIIITGATGMVGEGVLYECLNHPAVSAVLVINRTPTGYTHAKLKEIIHKDFFDLRPIAHQLAGYDACFFCLGVTSVGKKEDVYTKFTHTLTMHMASLLAQVNPAMSFSYVSGAGTDSTEKGRLMWARVKGKTENDLMNLPFRQVVAYRPGIIKPTKGLKFTHKFYHVFAWLFPIMKAINRKSFVTLKELGLSMINV
ncbi:MAG: epimerase, partial [Pedobacter sp.]